MSTVRRSKPSTGRKSATKQAGRTKASARLQLVAEGSAPYHGVSAAAARQRLSRPVAVVIDPEIMSGEPCFAGTRVPVRVLPDYIEGGDTIDEFLAQYPTVSRKLTVAFLEQAIERLFASV
jgi:uncharacterized protein (DUF433 family)